MVDVSWLTVHIKQYTPFPLFATVMPDKVAMNAELVTTDSWFQSEIRGDTFTLKRYFGLDLSVIQSASNLFIYKAQIWVNICLAVKIIRLLHSIKVLMRFFS